MAVTIKELSAHLGLSASAVSKALNGYSDIGEETRQRVLAAAEELGYRPNSIARGLKMKRSFHLGVVYQDASNSGFTHNYFGPVLEAFKNQAESQGYEITFISSNLSAALGTKMSYLEHSRYRGVEGICVVCCDYADPLIQELAGSEIPLISIDQRLGDCPCVLSENKLGMYTLTEYVIAQGHTDIALVMGEQGSIQETRLQGFLQALQKHGIEAKEDWIVQGKFHNPQIARRLVRDLLQAKEKPSCILMCDDYAALGAMDSIEELHLQIPKDISITGFDGVPILQMLKPKLCTIEQNTQEIGSKAAKMLIEMIEGRGEGIEKLSYIPTKLLYGQTVGKRN